MRAKILNLRYDPGLDGGLGGFDDHVLQEALGKREAVAFQARFFEVDEVPRLSCLIVARDADEAGEAGQATALEPAKPRAPRRPTADLELAPEERRAFDGLRAWRRTRAVELGVPAFRVLTDRQLAAVARARPLDLPALAALTDIGEARARRCGEALFTALRRDDGANG